MARSWTAPHKQLWMVLACRLTSVLMLSKKLVQVLVLVMVKVTSLMVGIHTDW